MNIKNNMRYIKAGITLFAAIAADMLVFFFLYRFDNIFSGIGRMISFVSPFLYGAVIAYLLAPLCNWLEPLLSRVLPRKKAAKSLSIFLALLLAILIMALLVIIVVPQLARSVITVANSLPGQLASLEKLIEEQLADKPEWQARAYCYTPFAYKPFYAAHVFRRQPQNSYLFYGCGTVFLPALHGYNSTIFLWNTP